MNNTKRLLVSNLYKKLGLDDEDLSQLVSLLIDEEHTLLTYKEAVCENISDYHNQKKELLQIIEELVIVLSATRDYEADRTSYTKRQQELLTDTGTEVLVKAFKALDK